MYGAIDFLSWMISGEHDGAIESKNDIEASFENELKGFTFNVPFCHGSPAQIIED